MADTYFTFGGISSTNFGIFIEKPHFPILPKTRERLLTISTRNGQYDFGPYFDVYAFSFDCWMIWDTRADLNAALEQVAQWLDPTAGNKPLVRSDMPNRYWNCHYSGLADIKDLILSYASFNLPFIAPDPIAKGI